jgi:hypothetical protein
MSGNEEVQELNPEHEPKNLVLDAPGPDSPGFLRRQDKLLRFSHMLEEADIKGTYNPDLVTEMMAFVLDFVVEPADRKEAEEILWELSMNQYLYVMNSLRQADSLVPPTSESS